MDAEHSKMIAESFYEIAKQQKHQAQALAAMAHVQKEGLDLITAYIARSENMAGVQKEMMDQMQEFAQKWLSPPQDDPPKE